MYRLRIIPRLLHFKLPAGTSRGVYTTRRIRYLALSSESKPGFTGLGECAPLPALSCDDVPDYDEILAGICRRVEQEGAFDREELRPWPSILFALETAFRHHERGSFRLWDTPFSRGEAGIPINGLIWMGDHAAMLRQIEEKLAAGFRCIKVKIGALRFDEELDLLHRVRREYGRDRVELRVDANGAFDASDAMARLEQLAALNLHSIEQPLMAGQWPEMARLCRQSPVPVALDEELIGCNDPARKRELLESINPRYIVLKPSLHGGLSGCREWIELARQAGIGWWLTSALESGIGMNAIAQWCATFDPVMPQGLGTGTLFTDNVPMPFSIKGDSLCFDPAGPFPSEQEVMHGHH